MHLNLNKLGVWKGNFPFEILSFQSYWLWENSALGLFALRPSTTPDELVCTIFSFGQYNRYS
jgi:hypothetical protein